MDFEIDKSRNLYHKRIFIENCRNLNKIKWQQNKLTYIRFELTQIVCGCPEYPYCKLKHCTVSIFQLSVRLITKIEVNFKVLLKVCEERGLVMDSNFYS